MRKFLLKFWVAFFILGWLVTTASGLVYAEGSKKSISSSKSNPFSANELLIQFKSEIKLTPSSFLNLNQSSGYPQLDLLNSRFQLKEIIPLIPGIKDSATLDEQTKILQICLFKFDNVSSLSKLKKYYESLDIVDVVEFNYYYSAVNSKLKRYSSLRQLQLEDAGPYITPNHSVIIGIIDTGIDWEMGHLLSNIWNNPLEKFDGKDNDANGFVDDIWGWNFVNQDLMSQFGFSRGNRPIDYSGHGTQIAEFINQIVNYHPLKDENERKNRLMILKAGIASPNGEIIFTTFSTAQAIIYAADQGAQVINLSWNGKFQSQVLQQAIDYAVNRGCIIIAAAGDKNSKAPYYPAAFANVWAVTSTDDEDKKFDDSNYGYWIDIAAPGLTKANPPSSDSTHSMPSGTAIAAATVSGLAGLLLSCENILESDSLKRRIIWSSENIYHKNPDYSGQLGAGRINVLRAINSQHQPNIIIQKISYNSNSKAQYLFPVDIVPITINIKNLSSAAQDINLKLTTNDPFLKILNSEVMLPHLDFQQEFTNVLNPFTLIIDNDYPSGHDARLLVAIETTNGFSLKQEFTFTNQINLPTSLVIIRRSPVTLKWTGNPEFIGYHIYRKNIEQQSHIRISEIPILETTYVDPIIETGTQYSYYVTGIDSSGWESPSSNVVTIKLRENPKFLFFPAQDTSISNQDSIRFVALLQFTNTENYTYQWLLNSEPIFIDSNSYFIDSHRFRNNNHDTVTVTITSIELDTSITHRWIIHLNDTVTRLKLKSVYPTSDTTLYVGDSLKLHIFFEYRKDDTLQFQWLVNEEIVHEQDSTFILFADSSGSATISVKISYDDTTYLHQWHINFESISQVDLNITIFPDGDTTIYEGDLLNLMMQITPQTDSLMNFQWLINGEVDSSAQQTSYVLSTDYFSAGVDTIAVNYELGDSTGCHQWLITILNRNRSPEIFSYSLPTDTTISIEDTLLFSVFALDPDRDSLSYRWHINQNLDMTALDSFYTFYDLEKGVESDTISVQISDNDTSIFHHWVVHYFNDLNQIPLIISCSPPIDSMLTKADSIQFSLHCDDLDGDTLRFIWSLNGWIDTSAHGATYFYRNLDSTLTNDTLKVIIADSDTSINLEWILWADNIEFESTLQRSISWFPEQDSLIAEGDSLIFRILNVNDSCRFQWKINRLIDSTANDSIFIYHRSNDSVVVDTIQVTIFNQHGVSSHEWYIHYSNLTEQQPPLRLAFKPEQDVIINSANDSLKFSVQIVEGEFSDLNFQWSINHKLDSSATETIFSYHPDYFPIAPDTVQLVVSRADTIISHQWIVHLCQQQTLPAPHPIFPINGNHISEEDKLVWEKDSSLTEIDSSRTWNYVVQLSSDSTFSTLISTDSCIITSIALNNLAGFDRISIEQPIYWRVKIFSGYNKISAFRKCAVPFYYYPQFSRIEDFHCQKNDNGNIDLFWTTSYDKNCGGFNIYRSESQDDNFQKINEYLITGQMNYSFQDPRPKAGKTYYYKLEEVSLNGKKKFHHAISITAPKPNKYSLSQNYPNPFNSKTSFKYEIPTASPVKIEVYNVLGRKVKTLVNEKKEAGFYTVYWDGIDDQGESVVSGIYFYYMITNKGKITRKMIVVR